MKTSILTILFFSLFCSSNAVLRAWNSEEWFRSERHLGGVSEHLKTVSLGCCCCSEDLRRHMAHRPSTPFMNIVYNLAKWLFLYSVYFSSLLFSIFFPFSNFFLLAHRLFFLFFFLLFLLFFFFFSPLVYIFF